MPPVVYCTCGVPAGLLHRGACLFHGLVTAEQVHRRDERRAGDAVEAKTIDASRYMAPDYQPPNAPSPEEDQGAPPLWTPDGTAIPFTAAGAPHVSTITTDSTTPLERRDRRSRFEKFHLHELLTFATALDAHRPMGRRLDYPLLDEVLRELGGRAR